MRPFCESADSILFYYITGCESCQGREMWAVWDEKRFLLAVFAFALDGVELALAEAEMLWSNLEKLVVK